MNESTKFSVVKVVLLFLFVLRFICASFFIHSHVIDGKQHIHSHPFSSGTESNDNHSEGELSFLDYIYQTVCTNDITLKFDTSATIIYIGHNFLDKKCPKASTGSDLTPSLRAPPIYL